jgi:hypothetical protein
VFNDCVALQQVRIDEHPQMRLVTKEGRAIFGFEILRDDRDQHETI